ncbi:hypothetical protein SLS62_003802 [Diatrype stigma]|uniref:Uncharacterized protein n=1 Tax=Diatrype stigma TaxID=117547 RepID=A0AAN9UXU3_9PEZI
MDEGLELKEVRTGLVSGQQRRGGGPSASRSDEAPAPARASGENGSSNGDDASEEDWDEFSDGDGSGYEEGEEHERLLDPNDPDKDGIELRHPATGGSAMFDDDAAMKAAEELEDSPYEEVRAAVHNYDEDLPCNTVRAWTIGLSLVVLGASANTLLSLRSPSIGLGPLVAQIIAYPAGRAWERFAPQKQYHTFGIHWSLNPGPFNVKEHSM